MAEGRKGYTVHSAEQTPSLSSLWTSDLLATGSSTWRELKLPGVQLSGYYYEIPILFNIHLSLICILDISHAPFIHS